MSPLVPHTQLGGPPSILSLASLVPNINIKISHLFAISVAYWGRFQYGESAFFCIVLPQAPRFVTAYLAGSSMACSWLG